jgi:hypothetical protein
VYRKSSPKFLAKMTEVASNEVDTGFLVIFFLSESPDDLIFVTV